MIEPSQVPLTSMTVLEIDRASSRCIGTICDHRPDSATPEQTEAYKRARENLQYLSSERASRMKRQRPPHLRKY